MKTTIINRNSTFELIRIIAIIYIILYHIISYFIYPLNNNIIYKTIQIPLHIGVILFILISGYHKIKFTIKGLFKFLLPIILIYTIINIFYKLIKEEAIGINDFLFLSQSPYWFIRTYLYLYILSPFINKFLTNEFNNKHIFFILGFMTLYMGNFSCDSSLTDGKNIINFIFLYFIGHYIKIYHLRIQKINRWIYFLTYCILNIIIMVSYYYYYYNELGLWIWKLSFKYNSPLLILNAILLFLFISCFKIQSRIINIIASSVFTMYLIHEHTIIRYGILQPIIHTFFYNTTTIQSFISIILLVIIIMITSCIINLFIQKITSKYFI